MAEQEAPYLGRGCKCPYTRRELAARWAWVLVQATLFRWSPEPLHAWRARLLRLFGARVDDVSRTVVFPSVRVHFPWKLHLEPRTMIGPGVHIYNLAPVTLRFGANLSQEVHLCAGTHDYKRWEMPLLALPVEVGRNAWLTAGVFVGPGVSIGELCVVGARSVVVSDLPPRTVCAGHPCKVIRERPEPV